MKNTSNLNALLLTALFTALTAVCAAISIPFGPVPLSLATLAVILAGGLLGAKYGAISQIVYVLLGAVGVPVFHSFTSGFGILIGPTGGYLAGYIVMAFLIGFFIKILPQGFVYTGISIAIGTIVLYTLGTIYFIFLTKSGLWAALTMCVFPFLPGDALKLIAGTILIQKLRPRIRL